MPANVFVHAAVFTAGALIGGGVAATVARRQSLPVAPKTQAVIIEPIPRSRPPIIEINSGGKATVTDLALSVPAIPPVLKYGHPGPISDLLVRKAYVAAYDRRLRHPAWTAEHLTLAALGKSTLSPPSETNSGDRSKSIFVEDESIPAMFRARLKDYFRSGYDRGHMVPAADAKSSQEAMNETFLLSNMAPQVGDGFNRHYWAYLENWCRGLTAKFTDVYVFTIPLYLPKLQADGKYRVTYEMIGNPPNIGVPTHFAKVVLATKPSSPATPDILSLSTGAFVLPNAVIPDEAPLEGFIVPVETVERAAGISLFSDAVKSTSKHICTTTSCQLVIRRFDDAKRKAIAAPKS